jgi:PPOX class probable F420-dependent enzyme
VQLSDEECWERLGQAARAVLCTTNAQGTVDAVPVCFAVVGGRVATPIDRVKPKRTTRLGRIVNLERDPRATLLCDHWDGDDWSRLWWVRARLLRIPGHDVDPPLWHSCAAALEMKYVIYQTSKFEDVLVFDVTDLLGWPAEADKRREADQE